MIGINILSLTTFFFMRILLLRFLTLVGLEKLYQISNNIVSLTATKGTLRYMASKLFYQSIRGC
jgi:hypothetical protein